jgi:hypothetical protein
VLVKTFAVGSVKLLVRLFVAVKEREHHDALPSSICFKFLSRFGFGSSFEVWSRLEMRTLAITNESNHSTTTSGRLSILRYDRSRAENESLILRAHSKGDDVYFRI